jgi:hypothetical protein
LVLISGQYEFCSCWRGSRIGAVKDSKPVDDGVVGERVKGEAGVGGIFAS